MPAPSKEVKSASPVAPPIERKEQKRLDAGERQRLAALRKPLENRVKRIDEQMAKLNAKKADIDARLLEPSIYDAGNKDQLKTLVADQAFVTRDLGQLEMEWLELQEQLEGLAA